MSNYNYSYFDNNNNEDDYDMDKLDKMAREINDKKKKNSMIKAVHNDFLEEEKRNKKQLEEILKNPHFQYFSAQGNINNTDDNSDNETNNNTINNTNNTMNDSFLKSLDNYQKHIAPVKNKQKYSKNKKPQDDNLSLLIEHLKKEHNSHIFSESESISSNSEESIIKHLKKCKKCKSKIQLVFDDNHKLKQIDNKIIPNSIVIKLSDLKEYMMIFLLIILILLVIYVFFKFK